MATLNFNAQEVDPNVGFDPVPADKYIAAITKSEIKPTKNGTGSYLELEFTIIEGQYKDRKVWDRLCLDHPNKQTVKIARGNLSAICHAVGVMQPQDSAQLHNLPLQIKVVCKKRDDTGEITNEVKGYSARGTSVPAGPQAPVTDATPPWRRN